MCLRRDDVTTPGLNSMATRQGKIPKVLINGRFLTQPMTGVQRFAYELTREFVSLAREKGVAVELLVPAASKGIPDDFPLMLKRSGWFGGYLWEQLILPALSRNALLVNLGNVAPLLKRKQIVLVYDAAVWRVPYAYTRQFRVLYKLLIPFVARRAKGLATISHSSARDISLFTGIGTDRITVLRAGAEHMSRVKATTTFAAGQGLERPFILAAGSLSPNKNFSAIVRAFGLIDTPRFDLVIVGGVESMVFAKSVMHSPDSVKFVGRVTDGELRELYEKAALFVFPSFYEGLGLPPMEAMICGCPVLLSDIPVLREIYADSAAYCNPADDRDVAAKIELLMSQPAYRAKLREKGCALTRQLSWRHGAEDLMDLIQDILGKP
jgi:glycosyltransferase involved in cell wall biosynthesis